MADALKITLAQLNPIVGDIDGNAQIMLDTWLEHDGECHLILFPELFLCGYPPEDLVLNTEFMNSITHKIEDICSQTKLYKSAALIPTIWTIEGKLYNAALIIDGGEITHICKKHKLPNTNVFDEMRTFNTGELPEPIDFRGHKIGIMICEDIWHIEVPKHLKERGAQQLIAINASPFHQQQYAKRKEAALKCVKEAGLGLIYLNIVGGQDELVFDGRSFIMNAKGDIIFKAPAFEDCIFNNAQKNAPLEINKLSLTYEALKLGLKDYVHKNGFTNVILGLSGGIDSALVTAIAVDALGANHVHCVMLPSEFTSSESLEDAKKCAELLGVKYDTIAIKNAIKTFENIIPNLNGLAHENTQSRIRGLILMTLSNMSGAMLLTTGNKSEMAVGYCTIYGDMNGGFNPLKDVYKTEVYELAKWRALPENIITKPPTAELRENQTDQDSLPPYDLLDDILYLLVECDDAKPDEYAKLKSRCLKHPEAIKQIAKLLKTTEYKRFQAPPGTRISHRAFGRDRRYPMTNNFVNKIAKAK